MKHLLYIPSGSYFLFYGSIIDKFPIYSMETAIEKHFIQESNIEQIIQKILRVGYSSASYEYAGIDIRYPLLKDEFEIVEI